MVRRLKTSTLIQAAEKVQQRRKVAVIPYIHSLSHGLKNVTNRYDIEVVFSAPKKLKRVCARAEKKGQKTEWTLCELWYQA